MSYLTINLSSIMSDASNTNAANSLIRQTFLTNPAVPVQAARTYEDVIPASTRVTIADTLRTLSHDATTQFQILIPKAAEPTTWRLKHTGTGTVPAFRTLRTTGVDATTQITIQVLSSEVARVSSVGGTTLNTAGITVGDSLFLEHTTDAFTSPFNASNTGTAVVIGGKGTGYIDVVHNGQFVDNSTVTLGTSFANAFRVFSSGPVKIADILELGPAFNIGNRKTVAITAVRDDYLEFSADAMVPETLIAASMKVYDRYINHIALKFSANCDVYADGERFPSALVDATGGYLFSSVKCNKLEIENTSLNSLTVSMQYSTVAGTSC